MKRLGLTVLNLLAVILSLVGVLWAYEHFVVQPREAARTAQLQEDVRRESQTQIDRRLGEVQKAGESLEASVDRSIQQVQQTLSNEAALMQQRSLVVDGLVRASMHKVSIAESYMSMGRWPASAEEAGLPQPASYASDSLRSISLEPEGVIVIAYASGIAEGGLIRLIPTVSPDHHMIDWRCVASGFTDRSLLPISCR